MKLQLTDEMIATKDLGKNFSEEEDIQLRRSYLYIAKDPKVGTNQKMSTLYERVRDYLTKV